MFLPRSSFVRALGVLSLAVFSLSAFPSCVTLSAKNASEPLKVAAVTPPQSDEKTEKKPAQSTKPAQPAPPAVVLPPIPIPRVSPPSSRTVLRSVSTSEKLLALTFDDGPHPVNTPKLLDALAERKVKATFYVIGNLVERYPAIVRRMVAEGHVVANHTWKHDYITRLSTRQVQRDLARTSQIITTTTGVAPVSFRPPGMATSLQLQNFIYEEFGYPTVLWNVDPQDWRRPGADVVAQRLIDGSTPGSILLLHDIHAASVDAAITAVDALLAKGYRFRTVSQLLSVEGAVAAR